MMDLESIINDDQIFAPAGGGDPDVPVVDVVNMGMDAIDKEADDESRGFVHILRTAYYDDDFLKENPAFKKQLDSLVESLRIMLKMRKADESAHDVIIHAIEQNSSNASLYRSLSDIQKAILSITEKIDDTKEKLLSLLKNYQLEINFREEQKVAATEADGDEDIAAKTTFRGSKDFINSIRKNS